MAGALSSWWLAARPKTLAAGIAPVLLGSALGAQVTGWNPLATAACLLGALLIQIGSNFANDAFDGQRGTDHSDRVGPTRAVAAGLLSARAMLIATAVVLALALLPGIYLASLAGWPLFMLGVISLICAVAYTGGPFPLAYHGLGDLFVLLFFGGFAVLGSAWVQAPALASWPPSWWWYAACLGLQATVIIAVNNQRDVVGDARAGKRTLAVRLGPRWHQWYIVLLHLGAIIALAVASHGAWLPLTVASLGALGHSWFVGSHQGRALGPALGMAAGVELATALSVIAWLVW